VAGIGAILAKYIFSVGSVWPFYAVVGFFVSIVHHRTGQAVLSAMHVTPMPHQARGSATHQIGLAMTLCAMEVVESCVAALFVCFAEDPRALADSKPETYTALTEAFRGFYPNAMPREV